VTDERLGTEAIELCRALVGIDTSNPPGNETPAAELVARYLGEAGEGRIEVELAGPDPDRLNVIARIRGTGEGPSLMLLGHTDVVPAPADSGWTVPPFEGRIEGTRMIGRGAADMKGELAGRAAALAAFARSGTTPRGDVVLVAESDEERGLSDVGMTWLVRERPELRCDFAVNEGGGNLYELADGRRVVTVGIGEKIVTSVRVRVRGRGGHASTPLDTENPMVYAADAIQRLAAAPADRRVVPAVGRAFEALGIGDLDGDALIGCARSQHPLLAPEIDAMTRLTVTPTGVTTHTPANVIPGYVDITCDCRLVPGAADPLAEIEAHVAAALEGGPGYELELLEPPEGGTESPAEGPLFEAIAAYVEAKCPGAVLLPILGTGFSDTAFVRAAWGSSAFGFAPILHTDPAVYYGGIHSADETIELADVAGIADFHLFAIEHLNRA
jgi:acetylornithine deacetylase/succinyl-diaminopimelate desuccinylase-like protein